MFLLLVRHGIAEDRAETALRSVPDARRELTPRGRKRLKRAASGLQRLVGSADVLASSPLVRARQSAEILRRRLGAPAPAILRQLVPSADPAAIEPWLQRQDDDAIVALVGHEPHLGRLLARLTGASGDAFVLGKGGAALLEIERTSRGWRGRLHWLLRPRALRRLS